MMLKWAYLNLSHFHFDLSGHFSHLERERDLKERGVGKNSSGGIERKISSGDPSSNAPSASVLLREVESRHEQQFIVKTSCFNVFVKVSIFIKYY